ncbi:MAG: hypothetical protein ACREA8_08805 [Nitrosotalea sp.]
MTQNPPQDMSDQEVASFHGHLASLWRRIQGLPLPVRQQLGLQEEENTAQDIGDIIASCQNKIENAIDNLPDDAQMSDKKKALQALSVTIPYHVSFGQKDEVWLNDAINAIIDGKDPNTSTVVSSTVPTSAAASPSATSANHEVLTDGAKPPIPEA